MIDVLQNLLFILLQGPANADDATALKWIAGLLAAAVSFLAIALIKTLTDQPKAIAALNLAHNQAMEQKTLRHETSIQKLHDDIKQIQGESADKYFKYSEMFHTTIADFSNLHPEIKEHFNALEKALKSENEKTLEKIEKLIKS